jgi:YesN/AraC family two-component response regulator
VPSLVILDLVMPELDGFAVLERMRADERTRAVPVVVISGQPLDHGDIRRLDHALVTLHSKGVLEAEETAAALHSALEARGRLGRQTSLAVKRAVAHIQRHYSSDLSLQQIAAAVGVSRNYLTQIFQHELGLSPWEYLSRYRIMQAKLLLQSAPTSIAGVAVRVGFEDASYFSRVFRKYVGCTPQTYRSRQT